MKNFKFESHRISQLNIFLSLFLFSFLALEPLVLKSLFTENTLFTENIKNILLILLFESALLFLYLSISYFSNLKRETAKLKIQKQLIHNISLNRKKIDQKIFTTAWNTSLLPYINWTLFKNHKNIFYCGLFTSIHIGLCLISPMIAISSLLISSFYIYHFHQHKSDSLKRFSKLNEFINQKDFYIDRDTIDNEKESLLQKLQEHNSTERSYFLKQKINSLVLESYWLFSCLTSIFIAYAVLETKSLPTLAIICISTYRLYIFAKWLQRDKISFEKPVKHINQIEYYLSTESYKAEDQDVKRALNMFKSFDDLSGNHYLLLVNENRIEEAKFLFKIWLEASKYKNDWSIIDHQQSELETLKQTSGISFFCASKINIEAAHIKEFRNQFRKSFSIDSMPTLAFEDTEVFYLDKDQKIKKVDFKSNFSRLSGDKGLVLSNWKNYDPSFEVFYEQLFELLKKKHQVTLYHTFSKIDKNHLVLDCPTGGKIVLTDDEKTLLSQATFIQHFRSNESQQDNLLKAKNFLANCTYFQPELRTEFMKKTS